MGLRPTEGLLQKDEILTLVKKTLEHGGQVSYHSNPDGSQSAYELNITWYDAINDPNNQDPDLDILRFLASQAVMLSLAGVPGIYIHSLFGSKNCFEFLEETARARSINRKKFHLEALNKELSDPSSLKSRILMGYRHLLLIRKKHSAFHPSAQQRVLELGPSVFGLLRKTPDNEAILCITNVTSRTLQISIRMADFDLPVNLIWTDQLTGKPFQVGDILRCELSPYQSRWLKKTIHKIS